MRSEDVMLPFDPPFDGANEDVLEDAAAELTVRPNADAEGDAFASEARPSGSGR